MISFRCIAIFPDFRSSAPRNEGQDAGLPKIISQITVSTGWILATQAHKLPEAQVMRL